MAVRASSRLLPDHGGSQQAQTVAGRYFSGFAGILIA
jgi:hypothetical protein